MGRNGSHHHNHHYHHNQHHLSKSMGKSAANGSAKAKLAMGQTQESYTPIKSLNTFLFDWKIKARVTKKHNKKTWKNMRG